LANPEATHMKTCSLFHGLVAAALITCSVGCANPRRAVSPDFWKDSRRKIGVAITPPPPLTVHQQNIYTGNLLGDALAEILIAAMNMNVGPHLTTLDAKRFAGVVDPFVQQLGARGFDARALPGPVVLSELKPFKTRSPDFAEMDLRPLGQQAQVDTLILLSLVECGATVTLGAPSGLCVSTGQMVDLATNRLMWRALMDTMDGTVRVEGEWNQAPDFPNLTAAIYKAIDQAQGFLVKDFFKTPEALGRAPRIRPGCTDTSEYRLASAAEKKRMLEDCRR
jgi:hypothetical protein